MTFSKGYAPFRAELVSVSNGYGILSIPNYS